MQKINVPILGLKDSCEARAVRDGECAVLHNITVDKEGAKIIAPPSKGTAVTGTLNEEFFHVTAGEWLSVRYNGVYNSKGVRINEIDKTVDGSVETLAFMGNLLIMYCKDGTVRYAIYDGYYRYLGRLPELPRLEVSIRPIHATILTENKYYAESAELSATDEGLKWSNASKGFFDECLNALYQQGAFVDRTLVRMAARLYDGSYISYSPIYYIEDIDSLIDAVYFPWQGQVLKIGRDNLNFISHPRDSGTRSKYFVSARGFVPTFTPEKCDISRWRDVIVGFDLFATTSIMGHESSNIKLQKGYVSKYEQTGDATVELTSINNHDRYIAKSGTKIREEISQAAMFYKIAEYDLNWEETWRLETTSPSQMTVQKTLPLNETPHELSGNTQKYLYNSKLHLAGVQERFCDAYNVFMHAGRNWEKITQITAVVTLETDDGKKTVVRNVATPQLFKQGEDYYLPPLLHYPDIRAKSIKLYVSYINRWNSSTLISREFPLTAHSVLNEAYYLSDSTEGNSYVTTTKKETPEMTESLEVLIEQNGRDNSFVTALKLKHDDREDFSGVYTFTYNAETKRWTMDAALDGSTTLQESVSLQWLGIKVFIGGVEITDFDYISGNVTALKGGEKITVTLKKDDSSFVGIKPIKVNGEGWSPVGSADVNITEDENKNIKSFTLKNTTDNRLFTRKNVMKLSEVDNPIFFPAKSTYSFDSGIMAISSNTIAVSQGQFGQHPLYVFTEEGVWLMTVDTSGRGSYLSQVPCSREKCANGRGVAATGQGIVFPTSMGLMIISGTETANLSANIAGLDTPELRKSGDVVERICGIVGKESIRSRVPFTEYLQNAFVAFDHNTNLLYVCNGEYDYVYVYNMTSGAWSSADGNYSSKTEHPGLLMLKHSHVDTTSGDKYHTRYTFDNYDKSIEDVPVVMVSRGCLFGSTGFKRMGKAALRATFYSDRLGFYLLGSIDGATWKVICGKECKLSATRAAPSENTNKKSVVRDLVCRSISSRAYRYAAFAFAGTVRNDARFAMIECEVQTAFEKTM